MTIVFEDETIMISLQKIGETDLNQEDNNPVMKT